MNTQRIFTEEQAMLYFSMILLALHFIHKKGIVHRDLKPANILIENFKNVQSSLKILKISDFGISKSDLQQMKQTHTLKSLTTPLYVSPETIMDQ